MRDGQRWLDQAQGQLQNTQVALNDKEAECRELATCLEEAAEQAKFFEVSLCPAAGVALLWVLPLPGRGATEVHPRENPLPWPPQIRAECDLGFADEVLACTGLPQ